MTFGDRDPGGPHHAAGPVDHQMPYVVPGRLVGDVGMGVELGVRGVETSSEPLKSNGPNVFSSSSSSYGRGPDSWRARMRPWWRSQVQAAFPEMHLFSDDELCAIGVLIRIVVAERSVLHQACEVAARLESLSPHLRVEVVPKTTHGLFLEKPELLTARILEAVPVKPGAWRPAMRGNGRAVRRSCPNRTVPSRRRPGRTRHPVPSGSARPGSTRPTAARRRVPLAGI